MPEIRIPITDGPPPSLQPPRAEPDPRSRLHELARELVRSQNRQLLFEYLRLRRALR